MVAFGDAIALFLFQHQPGPISTAPLPVRTRDAVVECPRGSRLCLLRWTLRFRLVRKMQIFGL